MKTLEKCQSHTAPTVAAVQGRIERAATRAGLGKTDWVQQQHLQAGEPQLPPYTSIYGLAGNIQIGRLQQSRAPQWLLDALVQSEQDAAEICCANETCKRALGPSVKSFVRQERKNGVVVALLHYCSPACMGVMVIIPQTQKPPPKGADPPRTRTQFPIRPKSILETEEEMMTDQQDRIMRAGQADATKAVGEIRVAEQKALQKITDAVAAATGLQTQIAQQVAQLPEQIKVATEAATRAALESLMERLYQTITPAFIAALGDVFKDLSLIAAGISKLDTAIQSKEVATRTRVGAQIEALGEAITTLLKQITERQAELHERIEQLVSESRAVAPELDPAVATPALEVQAPLKPRRGRPPGSKNKKKDDGKEFPSGRPVRGSWCK